MDNNVTLYFPFRNLQFTKKENDFEKFYGYQHPEITKKLKSNGLI